jgi:MFS family permease
LSVSHFSYCPTSTCLNLPLFHLPVWPVKIPCTIGAQYTSTATAAFVAYMVAMTTGRFVGDKLVVCTGIKALLNYSGWLIFCGLMLAVLLPYPITAGAGFMLVGLGVSCVVPLVFSIAGKSATLSSGAAIASISTIGYFGFLLVPPLVGYVAQAAGLRWSFGIIAMLGGLIVWMVSKIKEE